MRISDMHDHLNKRLSHVRKLSPQVNSFCIWAVTNLNVVKGGRRCS